MLGWPFIGCLSAREVSGKDLPYQAVLVLMTHLLADRHAIVEVATAEVSVVVIGGIGDHGHHATRYELER